MSTASLSNMLNLDLTKKYDRVTTSLDLSCKDWGKVLGALKEAQRENSTYFKTGLRVTAMPSVRKLTDADFIESLCAEDLCFWWGTTLDTAMDEVKIASGMRNPGLFIHLPSKTHSFKTDQPTVIVRQEQDSLVDNPSPWVAHQSTLSVDLTASEYLADHKTYGSELVRELVLPGSFIDEAAQAGPDDAGSFWSIVGEIPQLFVHNSRLSAAGIACVTFSGLAHRLESQADATMQGVEVSYYRARDSEDHKSFTPEKASSGKKSEAGACY